ncbi:EDD domain protein, DegV family [Actinopolyspora xinjiangensis]|uniref:EDD domain protein, DegV family n=1 Tax=Actinopolyspora xinjiangensis TaxID=405564 RepID=A0A1H0UNS5_9ACTN|nr:DegV family protein [Actinopolyspora xinjiangensis]SDP67791.1 EDD domain protein, DegV family [Actinopolyspora xinjiangensis]
MNQRVAIVTDSTASIPYRLAEQLGITVVQLDLTIDGESDDERRVPHSRLAEAMRGGLPVETSAPPAPAFFWNYSDAVSAGAEAIVSVHLSSRLSATCEAARTAAAEVSVPVHVVDSGLCGLGFGYPVIAAAEAAAEGADEHTVLDLLHQRLNGTTEMVYVDTLEYLRRSGRVGGGQASLAKALSIKPLLVMREGELHQLSRGIGPERALRKAVDQATNTSPGRVSVAAEHFQAPQRAKWVLDRLSGRLSPAREPLLEETSAIIGAHAGPGAVGITVTPA